MNMPTEADLVTALTDASRLAIGSLFKDHPENFYYVTLVTTGSANCPVISAWSHEALQRELVKQNVSVEDRLSLKWSVSDSPYFAYGEEHFGIARQMYEKRDTLHNLDCEKEFDVRIMTMEQAMATLDREGLFGQGDARLAIFINAEVMPPEYGNTVCGMRLNPKEAALDWLKEAAEWP